jgi:hypothetical protein
LVADGNIQECPRTIFGLPFAIGVAVLNPLPAEQAEAKIATAIARALARALFI